MMRNKLLSLIGMGLLVTACETGKVDCTGGCEGPIIFKDCVRDTVYFAFDKHHLDAAAQEIVAEQGKWLMENECATVTVEGYCDKRGTDAYNVALGQRRSDSVKNGLMAHGVGGDRVKTTSYGESRATGNHAMDRKTVTVIDEDGEGIGDE